MSGLTETTEASMVAAHQAGMAYWNRNKPYDATPENVKMLARTLGYRDETPKHSAPASMAPRNGLSKK